MNRSVFIFISCIAANAFAGISSAEFQHIADSIAPGVRFGASVRSVKTGQELAEVNGGDYFTPASTLKTLTTAAALTLLPANFAPETEFRLEGSITGRTFSGVVNVMGKGDPNVSARFYSDPLYLLYNVADSLKELGIDTIRGSIIADTSYFEGPRRPEHWRSNYFNSWYGTEIAPLAFNDNCVLVSVKPGTNAGDSAVISLTPDVGYVQVINNLRTVRGRARKWSYSLNPELPILTVNGTIGTSVGGSFVIPVRNPNAYFIAAFRRALTNRGIAIIDDYSIPGGIGIYETRVSGAPLLSMLDEINQRSQNLHAEMLFRDMGKAVTGSGSADGGLKAEKQFLASVGLPADDFQAYDGCGLSPLNKVKPSTETQLLAKMARSDRNDFYMQSFASPGVGSGRHRMLWLKAPWQIKFKTGFITGAHALVGYVFTLDGDTLAIATYLNDSGRISEGKSKELLDAVWMKVMHASTDGYQSLLQMKRIWYKGENVHGFQERLRYFSASLIGIPYSLGPMGEGAADTIEQKPPVNLDSVDCVTYIEHALALARSPSPDSIFATLQGIRYLNGKVSYATRRHYFVADWIGGGGNAKLISLPGDTTITRILPKNAFFAAKGLNYGKPDPALTFNYLPYDRALAFASTAWQGESTIRGVAFVGVSEAIDATHTGFLILDKGEKPRLRHASQVFGKVVEMQFDEYLESRAGKLPGIVNFEFIGE